MLAKVLPNLKHHSTAFLTPHIEFGANLAQVIAEAIGLSLKLLVNVVNLFMIGFVIFALAGVSLYQNSMKRQCVLPSGALPGRAVVKKQRRSYGIAGMMTVKCKQQETSCTPQCGMQGGI